MADAHAKRNKWLETVMDYSVRSLDKAEDKFPALASLAQIFASHMLDDYVAGIWKEDLLRSLSWGCLKIGTNSQVTNKRHEMFVAPTWSWASVDGPVGFSYVKKIDHSVFSNPDPNAREALQLMPKILGIHLPRVTEADPFGPLKAGAELRLSGYIVLATLGYDSSYDYLGQEIFLYLKPSSNLKQQNTGKAAGKAAGRAEDVGTLYFDVPSERAALNPREEVFVLYVHPWYSPSQTYRFRDGGKGFCAVGIGLVRTGTGEREYRRVGHVKPLSLQCFEGVRQEEIVIIN